jgi:hypothetical protein
VTQRDGFEIVKILRIRADEDARLNLHGSLGRSYVAEYRNSVLLRVQTECARLESSSRHHTWLFPKRKREVVIVNQNSKRRQNLLWALGENPPKWILLFLSYRVGRVR